MPEKFKAAKDIKLGIVLFCTPAIIWIAMLFIPNLVLAIIALLLTLLFTWCWFETFYIIDEENVYYRSGPFRGKVPVKNIRQLNPNATSWAGVRIALKFRYLRILYNTYDEVFIAPQEQDRFIETLMKMNPDIVVEEFRA